MDSNNSKSYKRLDKRMRRRMRRMKRYNISPINITIKNCHIEEIRQTII
jgi:hypothetical protein